MENKLQEITRKIVEDGVEKAKKEKDEILEAAKKEADSILSLARKEAQSIVEQSKKEAVQIQTRIMAEIRMAGGQAVSLLKQEIVDLLAGSALTREVQAVFNGPEFTKGMISEMISKGDFSGEDVDVSLTLPEKYREELMQFFQSKAVHILQTGVEIRFQSRMDGGFKIGPKDHSFVLSFTDRDFIQYFQSFLKPKAKEILFPGEPK